MFFSPVQGEKNPLKSSAICVKTGSFMQALSLRRLASELSAPPPQGLQYFILRCSSALIFPRLSSLGSKKLNADLLIKTPISVRLWIAARSELRLTRVHWRRWGIDAGQARNFKPHNDLVLKLHKILNKDRPPELKKNKDKMMKKY